MSRHDRRGAGYRPVRLMRWRSAAVMVCVAALAGCGSRTVTAHHTPTPTSPAATATPTAFATATATPIVSLPLFRDWRIAYLNDAGVLHALSLDGKTDLEGPGLGSGARAATTSPDGRTIAYLTARTEGPVTLIHVQTPGPSVVTPITAGYLAAAGWSRDGSRLAVPGLMQGATGLYIIDAAAGTATVVPQTGLGQASAYAGFEAQIIGWMDQSHLVISGGGREPQLLDVTTGATTPIAVPASLGIASLIPGGRQALLTGMCTGCCAPVKDVAVLDLATGDVRHLPNITAATDGFPPPIWRPGTTVAAGTMHPADPSQTTLALFDVSRDLVTSLVPHMFPIGWSPDGQTLLASRTTYGMTIQPIFAVNPVAAADQITPLPDIFGQLIGFVRTADGLAQGGTAPRALAVAGLGVPFARMRGMADQDRWLGVASSC